MNALPVGFHKWRWRLIALWIIVFSLATAYGLSLGKSALDGLCALRGDVQEAHDSAQQFLLDHPGREPIPGLSRQTLLISLHRQERTLRALSGLDCPSRDR